MREITFAALSDAVRELCIQANTQLPQDLQSALEASEKSEESPVGQNILHDLVENFKFAQEKCLPICQDTGMAVVFLDWGQECCLTGGSLEDAINDGVSRGYREGCLRLSVVSDPLRRENTNDNTPALIHLRMVPGDQVKLTIAPKGFGSENMTTLTMLRPSVSREQVVAHVVECVSNAGSNPCPPVVVGVGLGGDAEVAVELSKRALLRPVGSHHPDPFYAAMEREIFCRANRLGIGPQGLGGTTTVLQVAINPYPTHIAGLPCAVSLGCHATRHAETIL